MRAKLAHYMDTSADAANPVWSRIGEGFTDFTESKNAQEYTRQYINEQTETTDVTGYSPSIAYSADVYDDDPVCQKVVEISDDELVGDAAQVEIVTANEYEISGSETTCTAYKRTYSVIPDQKGSGVQQLVYTGTLRAVGDQVKGTFNPETKTFTA
jgi:hypothetical protein